MNKSQIARGYNQNILITDCSIGIGFCAAELLHQPGDNVLTVKQI
jgi:hypothetical protein